MFRWGLGCEPLRRMLRPGIATKSRLVRLGPASRTPRPPERPNRVLEAMQHSVGPVPYSFGTSPASTPYGSSASSCADSQGADARNIHARRSLFAGEGMSYPAFPAECGDVSGSGSPTSVPLGERHVPEPCSSRVSGASALIGSRQSARQRVVGPCSRYTLLRSTHSSVAAVPPMSGLSQS